jgi:RNA polymerase sigma-70 factor, ECF subfamily
MRTYQNMVFTTACRLVGNEAEAEDIAQEVFLKAYEHFDDLQPDPAAGGGLRTVARNLSLNHLVRYRSRWKAFSDLERSDDTGHPRDFAAELPAPDPHATAVDLAERHEILDNALQKLPPAQRVPLVLYHFENLSYAEIASRLNVSLGKVKTDIHRGRECLRRKLSRKKEMIEV